MTVQIERLTSGEGARWRSIRLRALSEAAHAFGTTYGETVRWTDARWEAQVTQFATFVAVLDGRDVGVARGAPHRSSELRELISLWADPCARRQRVAALLVDSVVAWAVAAGARGVVVDVMADNAAAIALYERVGFTRVNGDELDSPAPDPGELRLARIFDG